MSSRGHTVQVTGFSNLNRLQLCKRCHVMFDPADVCLVSAEMNAPGQMYAMVCMPPHRYS